MATSPATVGKPCGICGENILTVERSAHLREAHRDVMEKTQPKLRVFFWVVVASYIAVGGAMIGAALTVAKGSGWLPILTLVPLWSFLVLVGAGYMWASRLWANAAAPVLWRCPVCDRQVPHAGRRRHLVGVHGHGADLQWTLGRIVGGWLLGAFGGLMVSLSLVWLSAVSEQLFLDLVILFVGVPLALAAFAVISGLVMQPRRTSRLRAEWQTAHPAEGND